MVRTLAWWDEPTSCPIRSCDGSGIFETLDFTGSIITRCACSYGQDEIDAIDALDPEADRKRLAKLVDDDEPPAEVAERLALVIDAEVKARRRTQELLNNYLNRDGDRHDELCEDC